MQTSSQLQPEGGIEYFIIENIFDGLIVEVFIFSHEELHDFHTALLAEVDCRLYERLLRDLQLHGKKRIVWIMFVQPVVFIQYGNTRCFNRRNAAEQIPETLEMVFHFTAASHDIATCWIKDTIAGHRRCP